MTLDLPGLATVVDRHGPVVRVVVAAVEGSAPREAGAAMLVWPDGQSGTIGGGMLEYQAAQKARALGANPLVQRAPLGPAMGQCCGGAVTLVYECFNATAVAALGGGDATEALHVRQVAGSSPCPDGATLNPPELRNGWFAETLQPRATPVWIYGAGHVGRALAQVLIPLPDISVTLIDTGAERFRGAPEGADHLWAEDVPRLVAQAPENAQHFVMTYSHGLDLDLCHALLNHRFAYAGLIGSRTKWARFRSRLKKLGHADTVIDRITCPIGDPALGRHPQAIALSVASDLLRRAIPHAHPQELAG